MLFLGILQLSQGVYYKHAIPLSYSCISCGQGAGAFAFNMSAI